MVVPQDSLAKLNLHSEKKNTLVPDWTRYHIWNKGWDKLGGIAVYTYWTMYYYYYYYVTCIYYCTMRFTMLLQSVLLCVSSNSLFNVFIAFDRSSLIPILLRSCRIICIHVVFGLPCGLLTFLRYSSKAFLAGVSRCSLIICPNRVNRLIFISLAQSSHFAH